MRSSLKLFTTHNSCGAYGGRKRLSQAFHNRCIELHVGDIPSEDIDKILEMPCECPPSHANFETTSSYEWILSRKGAEVRLKQS